MGKIILAVVAGVASLFVIIGGGYEAGWWFQNNSTQREAHLIQAGFNFQSALGDRITQDIDDVTTVTTEIQSADKQGMKDYANSLRAQRESDGNTVCQLATEITGSLSPAAYQTHWIQANCRDGSVSPQSSIYYVGG